ncbi:MAG: AMP-binding protein [Epsilonproteobacteria bacterium]|nr:AMP-binding protein [Campylobacterota bacterium]
MAHRAHEKELFKKAYDQLCQGNEQLPCLGRLLQRTARMVPHNTALFYEDRSLTYLQLYFYATQLSKKLQASGVNPRDRVILLFENMPEFYIGYFGIVQIGAVVVPLNTFLQANEITHILDDAKPSMIIVSSSLAQMVQEAATARSIPLLTERDMESGSVPAVLTHFEVTDLDANEMAALLYTSGTTGTPKGVMISSKNIFTNVLQGVARFELQYTDRVFAVLPLFHSFAQNTCIWSSIFNGSSIILVPKIDRRAILKALQYEPTILLGVPALFGLLCLMKTAPLDKVRICIAGGDALPDRIRASFALVYRRKLCNGYGLTETSPIVSGDIEDELTCAANVGRPVVGMECLIKDETGYPVPQGQIGQLWVKGHNIMLGYYNAPEMTESILKDGWLSTGDLAYLDHKGRIVITGRYKDLIIHKGFNIYPQEIENVILMHPDTLRAAVIGKPDATNGEIPIAYVQLKQENNNIGAQLEALCAKNIATYKIPRQFICSVEPLPLTATGKVDKKVLKRLV